MKRLDRKEHVMKLVMCVFKNINVMIIIDMYTRILNYY